MCLVMRLLSFQDGANIKNNMHTLTGKLLALEALARPGMSPNQFRRGFYC